MVANFKSDLLSLAPMLGITNRHFRFLTRLISKDCVVYTEMIPANAIVFGKKYNLLEYNQNEQPLVLQLAGFDPKILADAALIAKNLGYKEINLNIGCPSSKTLAGGFGLCLLKDPLQVSQMVQTIKEKTDLPVSIKTRIGVDDQTNAEFLFDFINQSYQAGCEKFILHARPGILGGLSPKKNRIIPKIDYQMVYQVKKQFPNLQIIINGMINNCQASLEHLKFVDGVMLGRILTQNLWLLQKLSQEILDQTYQSKSLNQVLEEYFEYIQNQKNCKIASLLRPLISLFFAHPKAKKIRAIIASPSKSNIGISEVQKNLMTSLV